jgi:FXSXX-COOH protein
VTSLAAVDEEATFARDTTASADQISHLVDLSGVSLAELLANDNPVLRECLGRILEDADRPQDIVAGFQSAI